MNAATAPADAKAGGGAAARKKSAAPTGMIVGGLLAVAAAASLWFALSTGSSSRDPLPVLATVPDFALTEASGRAVSRQDLTGSPWVADLVFTHCAGTCPTMTSAMSRLVASSSTLPQVRFVSISVDPERDTPETLAAYAERFKADRQRWLFLTGDKDAIRSLAMNGLKLPLADGDPTQGEDAILHSERFVLIDGQSRIRGTYDVRDQEAMLQLRGDLERLTSGNDAG